MKYPLEFRELPEWAQKTLKRHIQPDGTLSGGIVVTEYAVAEYNNAKVLKFMVKGAEVFWISKPDARFDWRNWTVHQGRAIPSKDEVGFESGVYIAVTQPDCIVLFPRHTKLQELPYAPDDSGVTWGTIGNHDIPAFQQGQMGGVPWKFQNVNLYANPGTGGVSALFDLGYVFMTGELNDSTEWTWVTDYFMDKMHLPAIEKQYAKLATFALSETEME